MKAMPMETCKSFCEIFHKVAPTLLMRSGPAFERSVDYIPNSVTRKRGTPYSLRTSVQVVYRLTVDRKLGYLFERFPAFTQTFCARELAELYRQGASPPVYSIRRPTEARPANIPLENIPVYYLPDTNSLEFKIRTKLSFLPTQRSLVRVR